jgi:hypothetical protein
MKVEEDEDAPVGGLLEDQVQDLPGGEAEVTVADVAVGGIGAVGARQREREAERDAKRVELSEDGGEGIRTSVS